MAKILCPNCEHVVERDKFCSNCAIPLLSEQPKLEAGSSLQKMWEESSTTSKALILGFIVFVFIGFLFSLSGIPPSTQSTSPAIQPPSSVATSGNQSIAPAPPPIPKHDPAQLREQLKTDYQNTLAAANPYLNFIKGRITKDKKGYSLWAVHSLFSQSTFDMGDDVKVVGLWIQTNRQDLHDANIIRVGVKNESGYLGSCWLEVQ